MRRTISSHSLILSRRDFTLMSHLVTWRPTFSFNSLNILSNNTNNNHFNNINPFNNSTSNNIHFININNINLSTNYNQMKLCLPDSRLYSICHHAT